MELVMEFVPCSMPKYDIKAELAARVLCAVYWHGHNRLAALDVCV